MTASFQTEPLSDLIEGGGLIVKAAAPGQKLHEVDRDAIIPLFERHGVLLFRGFDLPPEGVPKVTDLYTESYIPDAVRRPRRYGSKVMGNVDKGDDEIGLHSEASFSPTWPEMIWFYCVVPSTKGAHTTVCDGVRLWKRLSPETQRAFLTRPVKYFYPSLMQEKLPGRGKTPWPFQSVGVDGFWDMDNGVAELFVLRFAVQESRTRLLAFANHVITDIEDLETTWGDGTPLSRELLEELRTAARPITVDIVWQPQDLVMLDNRRFTHGRRAFKHDSDDPRDIVQVQTSLASFAYGATMRKRRGA